MLRARIFIAKLINTHPGHMFYTAQEAFIQFVDNGNVDQNQEYIVIYIDNEWQLHQLV